MHDVIEIVDMATIGGFKISIKHLADYDADTLFYGEYTNDDWAEGYVVIPRRALGVYVGRNEYSHIKTDWSFQEARETIAYHLKNGASQKEARQKTAKAILAGPEFLEAINNGHEYFFGIVCTIEYNGIELGQASAWGFESTNTDLENEYMDIMAMAWDQVAENIKTISEIA